MVVPHLPQKFRETRFRLVSDRVVIRFQSSPRKNNIFFSENRLDKECRSGDALTERAMANRDPHWLRQRLVPKLAAQASAHLIHDHADPLA
jgi:hypothetical protein